MTRDFKAELERIGARLLDADFADGPSREERRAAYEKQQAQWAEAKLKADRADRELRLRRSGVRLRDSVVEAMLEPEGLEPTAALHEVATWWSDRRSPWCALTGGPGVGKTVAAAALVAQEGAVWLSSTDLVRAFAGMFGDAFELQEKARDCRLLVIDDVGSEADAERMGAALVSFMDWRPSARSTPTVLTTNLTRELWVARYPDPRLRSRMNEMVNWVELHPGDLRKKKS